MAVSKKSPIQSVQEPEIYARIRERSASLSPTKLAVAEYLVSRVEDAVFWPAARLAKAVGVSESVVIRLAADLGYEGYPAMQEALQDLVRQRLRNAAVRRDPASNCGNKVVDRVFNDNFRILAETQALNDRSCYETAVATLLGARQILTVGMRMAHPIAYALGFGLQLFLGKTEVLTAGADVLEHTLRRYGPGDVAVLCNFRTYNPITVQVAAVLRDRGVANIVLTDSLGDPTAQGAAVTLLTSTEGDFGSDRSLVGAMAVTNALIALACDQGGERCESSVQETIALRLKFQSNLSKG